MRYDVNERGHTMLEIISILGFLAAFSVGIIHVVSSMYDKYKVGRVTQQIEEIRKIVSNRYLAKGTFVGLSASRLISDGAVPNDMVSGTDSIRHAFSGDVELKGYFNRYTITFKKLPLEACIELAMISWTIGDSSDLINLKVNSNTYRWPSAPGAASRLLPVQLSDAGVSCNGDDNTIMWNFQ